MDNGINHPKQNGKIRILVVDDSKTARAIIIQMLNEDPMIEVIGEAENGQRAVKMTELLKPDLITMDIQMPLMDGLEATREIMKNTPTPIVVVSAQVNKTNQQTTFDALKAGAVEVLEKPWRHSNASYLKMRDNFLMTIRSMADVIVIKQWRRLVSSEGFDGYTLNGISIKPIFYEIIGIGASTGGPKALETLLMGFPADFGVPILVVQHMAKGFMEGFVSWLDQQVPLCVKIPEPNETIQPGYVYIAPDNHQIFVNAEKKVRLTPSAPIDGFCPSINVLFQSLANHFTNRAAVVLLTGMGNDGVRGMASVKAKGGLTIAQDEKSSLIYGMPKEAIEKGYAQKILSLDQIAKFLLHVRRLPK